MILFPAIDIKNQQCVRLMQGKFDQLTVYDQNPLRVAKSFQELGAAYLHVIDLDGAQTSAMENVSIIKSMVDSLTIPIQVGGGIRTIKRLESLLSLGVSRVIVGTMAIEFLPLLEQLVAMYPEKIIVSIDAYKGYVATHGWQTVEKETVLSLCKKLETIGITTIVYTDIEKDGMMQGPNFEAYKELVDQTSLQIIASGGVSKMDDLIELKHIGVYGAIVGKALYENTIDLKEALQCLQSA